MLPPNYQIRPLKSDPFLMLSQKAQRNTSISQPSGGIFKNLTYFFQFGVKTEGSAGETTYLSSWYISMMPQKHLLENGAKTGKNGIFCFFCSGTTVIDMRGSFLCWDCSPDAELQTYVSLFENVRTGRVLCPSWRSGSCLLKVRFFGGRRPCGIPDGSKPLWRVSRGKLLCPRTHLIGFSGAAVP